MNNITIKKVMAYFARCVMCRDNFTSMIKADVKAWADDHKCKYDPNLKMCQSCLYSRGYMSCRKKIFWEIVLDNTTFSDHENKCKAWECKKRLVKYERKKMVDATFVEVCAGEEIERRKCDRLLQAVVWKNVLG